MFRLLIASALCMGLAMGQLIRKFMFTEFYSILIHTASF